MVQAPMCASSWQRGDARVPSSPAGPPSRLPAGHDDRRAPRHVRIVAISSGGGHWVQLSRLRPVLDEFETRYVCVDPSYAQEVGSERLAVVRDASRWNKLALALLCGQVLWVLLRLRPGVVITTGAAPGFFGLLFGKLLGARTVWIDSLANVEEISLSGRCARRYADLWLTQWPHLARPDGPHYM